MRWEILLEILHGYRVVLLDYVVEKLLHLVLGKLAVVQVVLVVLVHVELRVLHLHAIVLATVREHLALVRLAVVHKLGSVEPSNLVGRLVLHDHVATTLVLCLTRGLLD